MKIIYGDLLDYATEGVILHQVNCQNAMGSGFAKAFYTKYPVIKERFHITSERVLEKYNNKETRINPLLGQMQWVKINENLFGINCFTQEYYGNSLENGVKYTREDLLIRNIGKALKRLEQHDLELFIPERVGCGLAGGNWDNILEGLEQFNTDRLTIVSFHQ